MKLLVIDGNSILNRAFYGIKLLSNKNGVFTNAVFGFANIYFKTVDEIKPDCIAVAFDMRKPTFRHTAVATYKANRKGMPDELAQQLPIVKELLTLMGVSVLECEGFEADDILGTLAQAASDSENECIVLTGDKDSLQLINDRVNVRLVTTKEHILYDEAKFREVYGFEPINLIDLKALMGDSSDNISGVTGIGEKTASALIKQWGTVEKLYENLDNAGLAKGAYAKLSAGREQADQSKWLATIVKNAPVSKDISDYLPKAMDVDGIRRLLSELEMFKLLDKLKLVAVAVATKAASAPKAPKVKRNINVSELDMQKLDDLIKTADTIDFILIDDFLQLAHEDDIFSTDDSTLVEKFVSCSLKKRTFNAKHAYHYALEHGTELCGIAFDAEIAGYLLNPSSSEYSVERLCAEYDTEYDNEIMGFGYIISLTELCDKLAAEIDRLGMTSLLFDIEQPLTEVLASMEHYGIKVNSEGVREFGNGLSDEIEELELLIYEEAGGKFNIASPKQLAEVLFERMGLPSRKKTKSGYSTNAEVLESLRPYSPIIDMILKYRQYTKLNSTYVEGLLKTVCEDGRIHSVFKQTETRTGRISSIEPNMQNIPVRTELGRNMRKFFVADSGKILLDADYSQIELRITAHLCDDKNMLDAFRNGVDIHTATAAQVFNLPVDMVTGTMRSAAKAVNFGIIYGIGAFSLSKDINVSVAEAKKYIENYLKNFPNVERFMNETVENAAKDGYVTTMYGRRRQIPELSSSNKNIQAAGKRIAMNTPIQGTAADIIKIAMVKVYKRLKAEMLKARLILQVHDELIVEAETADAEKAAVILREEMENAAKLSIALDAEVNRGRSWYDAKG